VVTVIAIVTGPPGSGKSFYAVRKIIDSLEAGKFVATNLAMREDWIDRAVNRHPMRWAIPGRRRSLLKRWKSHTYLGSELEQLMQVRLRGSGEGRGVMVLDEAHHWMNARTWSDTDRLKLLRFFSAHRHYGWDIYLLTQDINNIDRQVRALFEYHIQLSNLKKFKVAGVPVSPCNLFLARWEWHSASKAVVKRECYRLNYACKLYDTHGLARELDDDDPAAIWLPAPTPPHPADAAA
jgi:zona occludens toxin (predicted ATPase)